MGILIRKPILYTALCILPLFIGCNPSSGPARSVDESELSFSVSAAAAAIKAPQELSISLANEFGFYQEQGIQDPPNMGSVEFPRVPYGHIFIDIQGMNNGVKTLYGHAERDVMGPNEHADVVLRKIISVKTSIINVEQDVLTPGVRSVIWNNLPSFSTAVCATSPRGTALRTSILSTDQYFYFLFDITDNSFYNDDRQVNQFGEMTNDAVILYLCRIPPHNLAPDNGTFPVVRLQCEVGKVLDPDSRFNFINFANNTTRDLNLQELDNDEVRGQLLREVGGDIQRRTFEVRINKDLLSIPREIEQLGIVIRYRDSYDPSQPVQLSDWQSGLEDSNPKLNLTSWGYLEITP